MHMTLNFMVLLLRNTGPVNDRTPVAQSENPAELSRWKDVLHSCHREYKINKLKSELNSMKIK